jgi:hypothetical protein
MQDEILCLMAADKSQSVRTTGSWELNRTNSNLVEFRELTATDFKGIVDWAGDIGRTVRNKSLGMAFFVLQNCRSSRWKCLYA